LLTNIQYLYHKVVAESAGCAAFAALMSGKVKGIEGKNVVCVVSGGNVSSEELQTVAAKLA
jgi:threonine dehydratase